MPIEKEDTIGLKYWSTKADENANSDPQINWKEGQMPSTVNNSARMMMARLKENELVTSQRFDNLENLIKNFIKQDSNILQLTIKKIYPLLSDTVSTFSNLKKYVIEKYFQDYEYMCAFVEMEDVILDDFEDLKKYHSVQLVYDRNAFDEEAFNSFKGIFILRFNVLSKNISSPKITTIFLHHTNKYKLKNSKLNKVFLGSLSSYCFDIIPLKWGEDDNLYFNDTRNATNSYNITKERIINSERHYDEDGYLIYFHGEVKAYLKTTFKWESRNTFSLHKNMINNTEGIYLNTGNTNHEVTLFMDSTIPIPYSGSLYIKNIISNALDRFLNYYKEYNNQTYLTSIETIFWSRNKPDRHTTWGFQLESSPRSDIEHDVIYFWCQPNINNSNPNIYPASYYEFLPLEVMFNIFRS